MSYIDSIASALQTALCLQYVPSRSAERQTRPEVELSQNQDMIYPPVMLQKSPEQKVLVESSVNSVRVSVLFKKTDQVDQYLTNKYLRFIESQADDLKIIRKTPVSGYDFSFLITYQLVEQHGKPKLVQFVCDFVENTEKEVNSLKLKVSERATAVMKQWTDETK
ncbi:Arp [Hexamita inflata]|uniref:Arp n=1 Tax=Hexamita inflata TaxID=28002 RepID=A0AA86V0H8_9EUKA|nr:Arp [Hexamita inflata]CAI9971457.1 Arp [Hexamita inflata]